MGLGCAVVTPLDPDGFFLPEEGRRCFPFNYTGKVLISIPDYNKLMKIEFARVRRLTAQSKWVVNAMEPGVIYTDESVMKLKSVGKKTNDKLNSMGIKIVSDLQKILDPNQVLLPQGFSKKAFQQVWQYAKDASLEKTPSPIDHRKALNPYLSRYGEGQWEKFLKKSPTLSTSVVITDYIEHMMAESKRVMADTMHSSDWMVYHDALSLMTSRETKEWMSTRGYLKRWILPSDDLYVNDDELKKKYNNNPLGNSPEFMPWDAHLNMDLHSAVDHHCLLSKHLDDKDKRKFSIATPKNMIGAYSRLLDPNTGTCPPSHRIIQDVRRVLVAFKKVMQAQGCLVNDSRITSGRRYESTETSKKQWGGKRNKRNPTEYSPGYEAIHTDLWEVVRESNSASLRRASIQNIDDAENEGNNAATNNNPQNENNEIVESENFAVPEASETAEI